MIGSSTKPVVGELRVHSLGYLYQRTASVPKMMLKNPKPMMVMFCSLKECTAASHVHRYFWQREMKGGYWKKKIIIIFRVGEFFFCSGRLPW